MDEEKFEYLINILLKFRSIEESAKKLGFLSIESPICDQFYKLFDFTVDQFFDDEGADWIYWWLYDKSSSNDLKAFDENENEIPTDTIKDLWNIIKEKLKK